MLSSIIFEWESSFSHFFAALPSPTSCQDHHRSSLSPTASLLWKMDNAQSVASVSLWEMEYAYRGWEIARHTILSKEYALAAMLGTLSTETLPVWWTPKQTWWWDALANSKILAYLASRDSISTGTATVNLWILSAWGSTTAPRPAKPAMSHMHLEWIKANVFLIFKSLKGSTMPALPLLGKINVRAARMASTSLECVLSPIPIVVLPILIILFTVIPAFILMSSVEIPVSL